MCILLSSELSVEEWIKKFEAILFIRYVGNTMESACIELFSINSAANCPSPNNLPRAENQRKKNTMSMPPRPPYGPPGTPVAPMGQRPPGYGSPVMGGPRPGQPGQMVSLPHRQGPGKR